MTDNLTLHQISVSEMDNNCYLLVSGDEGLLIDAADDARALLSLAEEAGARITAVLTTHRHPDHHRALVAVLEETGATHFAPFLDALDRLLLLLERLRERGIEVEHLDLGGEDRKSVV